MRLVNKVLFDPEDHELLHIVNDMLTHDKTRKHLKKLFGPYLHPHGIKEMAASMELRIAYAVIYLLDLLEGGKAEDRLSALRSLVDEVLHTAESALRRNTARVLLQIMKELVRSHGNYQRQLELAHDFRATTSGNPRIVREQLRQYHLLEMPEEWNQVTFDDHVHDAHTKGRKSPTHLIMDAWIKGIRSLTVIYYNYVEPDAAQELLEAAYIMGMTVRIGIELSARFRDKYVQLIYGPRGFSDTQDFLEFLADPAVKAFMAEGRKVSEYQQRYVMLMLEEFNTKHRHTINTRYEIQLEPISQADFLAFVSTGQPSLVHLAELIHARMLPAMKTRVKELRSVYAVASEEERTRIEHLVEEMNRVDAEPLFEAYLRTDLNPTLPDPDVPRDDPDLPELLTYSPQTLLKRISQFHAWYRITLNLSNLTVEDVLELLYDCEGKITHLEIFNLKDYAAGKNKHQDAINELRRAINEGNVITLKRSIRTIIQHVEALNAPDAADRIAKLTEVLRNIPKLHDFYKPAPLNACIGTDSVGRATHLQHGMGLAIQKTLPRRVQKELNTGDDPMRQKLPVQREAYLQVTYKPYPTTNPAWNAVVWLLNHAPGLWILGQKRRADWVEVENSTRLEKVGNIVTLGGILTVLDNGLSLTPRNVEHTSPRLSWQYVNDGVKAGFKVLIGFIPAFLTFFLTQDWWVLKYCGALLWFGITGLRNVLQAVLGGGGLRRSPLLKWKDYVKWERIADSLLYTGFSVPLLDYVIKTQLLNHTLHITTATNPSLLYALMALMNGVYIAMHNTFRGFPKGVILGNLFRNLLAIPLAIALNMVAGGILTSIGAEEVAAILQKWATVILKIASDTVGGVIEGLANRYQNVRMRILDYEGKLAQLRDAYTQLELLFPEADVLEMLKSPKKFIAQLDTTAKRLEKILIINALDLMYFWMYQPRARSVLRDLMEDMSEEEIEILARSQHVLQRQREVSKLFINGLLGYNFSRALAFYLDRSKEYIRAMDRLTSECLEQKRSEKRAEEGSVNGIQ